MTTDHRPHAGGELRRPRPRPAPLQGPRGHCRGPAHGGARRLRRHHRPALGPAGPPHLDRQSPVDADRVHPLLRGSAPARRPDRRLLRTQEDVRDQPPRLRRGLGPRRPGPELGHALQRPRAAGRVRRRHGTCRALVAHRDLHRAAGAGPGFRRLRRHRRGWCCHRPHPRRGADRVRVLALDPPHQRAHRRPGRRRSAPRRFGEPRLGQSRLRPSGSGHRDRRSPRTRLWLHQGRHRRLGRRRSRSRCSPLPRCSSSPS